MYFPTIYYDVVLHFCENKSEVDGIINKYNELSEKMETLPAYQNLSSELHELSFILTMRYVNLLQDTLYYLFL